MKKRVLLITTTAAVLLAAVTLMSRGQPSRAYGRDATAPRAAAPMTQEETPSGAVVEPRARGLRRQPSVPPDVTVHVEHAAVGTTNASEAPPIHEPSPEDGVIEEEPLTPRWQRFREDVRRYMLTVVAPRARDCFVRIPGNGKILFRYALEHETGRGVGQVRPAFPDEVEAPVTIMESGLDPAHAALALECMLDAVEGTSYETELPYDDAGPSVVLFQDWQVGKPEE